MKNKEKIKEKLERELNKYQILSVDEFRFSDIFIGLFISLFMVSIFMWIPVIGWIMIPISIIMSFGMAVSARQKAAQKQVDKIKKKLDTLNGLDI